MANIFIHYAHTHWPNVETVRGKRRPSSRRPFRKTMRRAAKATLAAFDLPDGVEVAISLVRDEAIRHLNRTYRHRDSTTNVLAFAMTGDEEDATASPSPLSLLGDVVLGYETVVREAEERNIPMKHHVAHLIVHGTLHLLGYDHARSQAEANRQERQEMAILARLGVANPYA